MGLSARRSGGGGAAQGHPNQSSGARSTTATPLRGSRTRFTQALAGGRSGRGVREWGQCRAVRRQIQQVAKHAGNTCMHTCVVAVCMQNGLINKRKRLSTCTAITVHAPLNCRGRGKRKMPLDAGPLLHMSSAPTEPSHPHTQHR